MEKIYSKEPSSRVTSSVKKAWENAGPYDLSELVNNGSVIVDETSDVGQNSNGSY